MRSFSNRGSIQIHFFSLALIFSFSGFAQNSTFQETIGGTRSDFPYSISTNSDGGYLICGTADAFISGFTKNAMLIRLDQNGDTLWEKIYGGAGDDVAFRGFQTLNGGFAAVGYTMSYRCGYFMNGLVDTYFFTTDVNGNYQIMSGIYGDPQSATFGMAMVQDPDSNFVILANSNIVNNPQSQDVILFKIRKPYGDTVWTRRYNTPDADYGYSLARTNDGGYVITGCTQSLPNLPGFIMKTDSVGNLLWSKSIPCMASNGVSNEFFSCRQTSDHGYIIAGELWTTPANNVEIYLIKTDSAANPLWAESIHPQSVSTGCIVYPTCIEETKDKGFIISSIFSAPGNMDDNYVLKTDSVGNVNWAKRYGGPNDERLSGMSSVPYGDQNVQSYNVTRSWLTVNDNFQSTSSVFALTSFTNSFIPSSNQSDVYVVKTDSNGNSWCNDINDSAVVTPQTAVLGNFPISVSCVNMCYSAPEGLPHVDNLGFAPNFICESPAGISDQMSFSFTVFPNPTADLMKLNRSSRGKAKISICNMVGEKVFESIIENQNETIDVSNLSVGIYFIIVSDGENSCVQKFVKQ